MKTTLTAALLAVLVLLPSFQYSSTPAPIISGLEILKDRPGELSANEAAVSVDFEPASVPFRIYDCTYWVRFDAVVSRQGHWWLLFDDYRLSTIEVYRQNGKGVVQVDRGGLSTPVESRPVPDRLNAFRLKLPAKVTQTWLLRVEAPRAHFNFSLADDAALSNRIRQQTARDFLICGIFLFLFLYQVTNAIRRQSSSALFFSIYIMSTLLFLQANSGFAFQYYWGHLPYFHQRADAVFLFFMAVNFILFSRRVIWAETSKRHFRLVENGIITLMLVALVTHVALFEATTYYLYTGITLLGALMLLSAGYYALSRKVRGAPLYLLSFAGLVFGVVFFFLEYYLLLPDSRVSSGYLEIGFTLQALFLAGALHDYHTATAQGENTEAVTGSSSRFVPDAVLDLLGKNAETAKAGDAAEQHMAVLFVDIRSFTELSEEMSPEETFLFINNYLKRLTPPIESNKGFIVEFFGDVIIALFPRNSHDALVAALQLQSEVESYNVDRSNFEYRPIEISSGLHYGKVRMGLVGSEEFLETTLVSTAVDIAGRLEGITEKAGSPLIISESFKKTLPRDPSLHFELRLLGYIRLKEENEPIYQVFYRDDDDLESDHAEAAPGIIDEEDLRRFEEAVKQFYRGHFEDAAELFNHLPETVAGQEDLARLRYLDSIRRRLKKQGD